MQRNLQIYLFIKHLQLRILTENTQPLYPLIFETFLLLNALRRKRENPEKS